MKTEANVWENSRADQITCSRILTNIAEVFNRLWRHGKKCFISFIKLLFSLLTKRKTIYEARTVNSYNTDTVKPHCSRHFRTEELLSFLFYLINNLIYIYERVFFGKNTQKNNFDLLFEQVSQRLRKSWHLIPKFCAFP